MKEENEKGGAKRENHKKKMPQKLMQNIFKIRSLRRTNKTQMP